MTVTIAGITCQEEVHDYSEEYDIQGGPSAHKVYLCPWANRFTVIHGILGLTSVPSLGGLISLQVPMQYPELAAESTNALASMYARNVVCTGVGSPAQGANNITFTTARIQVTFGNYPWSFQGIDYFQLDPTRPLIWVEQHTDFSGEFITIPGTQVFDSFTTKPVANAQWGFFSPQIDMTLTLKNVPYLPAPEILQASQKPLNSRTYLGCAPGFLMFKGMQDDRTHAPDGTPTGSITLGFSFRTIAQWDCIYSPTNTAGSAYNNGTGTPTQTPPYWSQVLAVAGGATVQGHSDLSSIMPAAYGT